ncbi:MAG: TetR/AcrR family transcriptional regulator [Ruminococcaceae bacterium]|nr:TetR/AcrR family transcriptional regulator [Oscillospiraceae bacterium]
MDRRQKKTRRAIFSAFTYLLSRKKYSGITIGEIIDEADVGRATFYSHFETKDHLLKELCQELFCHVFDSLDGNEKGHCHIFECDSKENVFLHLLRHLDKNDNNVSKLLVGENNELFLGYFKNELGRLVVGRSEIKGLAKNRNIPEDYWINHVSVCFVETVKWWLSGKNNDTPERVYEYFLGALGVG